MCCDLKQCIWKCDGHWSKIVRYPIPNFGAVKFRCCSDFSCWSKLACEAYASTPHIYFISESCLQLTHLKGMAFNIMCSGCSDREARYRRLRSSQSFYVTYQLHSNYFLGWSVFNKKMSMQWPEDGQIPVLGFLAILLCHLNGAMQTKWTFVLLRDFVFYSAPSVCLAANNAVFTKKLINLGYGRA